MPDIALPAFHVTATRKVTVELNHELATELERYRQFYKHAYGADVSEADLLREMGRRFMEADREFQAFKATLKAKGRNVRRPNSAPAPAEGGLK
jgi:hypothetical protein